MTRQQIDEAFGAVHGARRLDAELQCRAHPAGPRHHQSQSAAGGAIRVGDSCPSGAKDGKNNARMINARAEGILDKPSFRKPVRERRCLVLADSFYEWRTSGQGEAAFPHPADRVACPRCVCRPLGVLARQRQSRSRAAYILHHYYRAQR